MSNVISTSLTTFQTFASGFNYLLEGASITSTTASAWVSDGTVSGSTAQVDIIAAGQVAGQFDGIRGDGVATYNTTVTSTGSVYGLTEGIELSGSTNRVSNDGFISGRVNAVILTNTNSVFNTGAISGTFDGVEASGDSFLSNSGTISGSTAVNFTTGTADVINNGDILGQSRGLDSGSAQLELVNNGTISGESFGITVAGTGSSITNNGSILATNNEAITNSGGADLSLTNFGTISTLSARAVGLFGTDNVLVNHGIISGVAAAVTFATSAVVATAGGDVLDVTNLGTITSTNGASLGGSSGADMIVNAGILGGTVLLEGGIDTVTNSGKIDGDINFGADNDVYNGMSSGSVTGRINGDGGNDTLTGSDANDDIRGGNQGDLIEGGGGNDALLGEQGQDIINGGDGNDRLFGQANGDRLDGGSGLDFLTGGLAADVFFFRQGNDVDIIQDFADGTAEKIDVSDFATADAMAAIAGAYQVGNQVRINFGDGDLLALNGVTVAQIDNSDFIFA